MSYEEPEPIITIPKSCVAEMLEGDPVYDRANKYLVRIPATAAFPSENYVLEVPEYMTCFTGPQLTIYDLGRDFLARFYKPAKGTRHKRYHFSAEDLPAIFAPEIAKNRRCQQQAACPQDRTDQRPRTPRLCARLNLRKHVQGLDAGRRNRSRKGQLKAV